MTYVRQHHFHKQKIYLGLPRIFSIDPASISVKKGLFSSKQHRSTRRNNSLHPGYLTSLVTRTNHNPIQTIGIYVRVFRTADHTGQIFIPHRRSNVLAPKRRHPKVTYLHVDVHAKLEHIDVILSSSHTKKLAFFVPEFRIWTNTNLENLSS